MNHLKGNNSDSGTSCCFKEFNSESEIPKVIVQVWPVLFKVRKMPYMYRHIGEYYNDVKIKIIQWNTQPTDGLPTTNGEVVKKVYVSVF